VRATLDIPWARSFRRSADTGPCVVPEAGIHGFRGLDDLATTNRRGFVQGVFFAPEAAHERVHPIGTYIPHFLRRPVQNGTEEPFGALAAEPLQDALLDLGHGFPAAEQIAALGLELRRFT
jgi:hypothetical protein